MKHQALKQRTVVWLLLVVFAIMFSGCASLDSKKPDIRQTAVKRLTDQALLAKIAMEDESFSVREIAVKKLTDQALLAKITMEKEHFPVRKVAFLKLSRAELIQLSTNTENPTIRIAADVKLQNSTWNKVFAKNSLKDFLGAIALFNKQSDDIPTILEACHKCIRKGEESRIAELKELLLLYGDISFAEDYMNCGQSDLASAGRSWASSHGYNVLTGDGSSRVTWGSDRD
jgi:hypothetical protein